MTQPVVGQGKSCDETLTRARESFDLGHLYDIPALLKPCLDNGFNKVQRMQAYLLLTRTYLLIDDPISAENSYLNLLRLDPEYKVDEDQDPVDIVYLSKKFTTTPIFVVFAKAGFTVTNVDVIHNFGTDNTAQSNENYRNKAGFSISAGSELNINDRLSLGLELAFAQHNYSYQNSFFNNDQQVFEEHLTTVSVPLYVKYRLKFDKIRPFIYAGYSTDFIISSTGSLKLTDKVNAESSEEIAEFPVTGPDISLTDLRNLRNSSVLFGIGTNYRVGYNYFTLDIRYKVGLTNIVDEANQYSNTELLYKYAYVDDDKRINNFWVSVGYVKPLYKPRKKEDGKKGFLKNLFK